MTLWIVLTILTSAAAVIAAAPLLRRLDEARAREAASTAVYKDQLAEIERERQEGLIDAGEADLARVEIERRILAVGKTADTGGSPLAPQWQARTVVAVAGLVVLGSVGLYAATGRPELPAAPFVEQGATSRTAGPSPAQPTGRSVGDGQNGGNVETMIRRLEADLRTNPDSADGWRMLGWSYYNTGRYSEAVEAYRKAVELQKDNPDLKALYGEALVRAANGRVTEEALEVFDAVLAINPDDERARFFHGMAKQQDGDPQAALEEWIALLKVAPAGAEWAGDLRQHILKVARQTGTDVSGSLPEAAPSGSQPLTQARTPRGPSAEDIREASEQTPEQQQAMIRNMVDGLAARLETEPRDVGGWIMLIRSRMVLEEPDAARAALDKARTVFADEPATLERIAKAADALGVTTD